MRNRTLMQIKEVNSSPLKNVGLGLHQVNQMQEGTTTQDSVGKHSLNQRVCSTIARRNYLQSDEPFLH